MTMSQNEKAFPFSRKQLVIVDDVASEVQVSTEGMDLRDYFAAQALNGLASITGVDWGGKAEVARICYDLADAMMKARGQ